MNIIKGLTTGLFVIVCMTKISTATSIIYDFTGTNTGIHNSLNVTVDGVGVNITPWANLKAEDSSNQWFQVAGPGGVYDGSGGLGVQMGNGIDWNALDGQTGSADGIDYDEGLMFAFEGPINLVSIDFGGWQRWDDFNLTIDGVDIFEDNNSDPFVTSYIGTEFRIWADHHSDAFRIRELTVEPVPEPATIALLGIGLAGIAGGTARRRLKKTKTS